MRLKGRDWREVRRWKQVQAEFGYLPHYHRRGRILMEVRFLLPCKAGWRVLNLCRGVIYEFRRNGTPLNGTGGRLVGPLIEKRKVKK